MKIDQFDDLLNASSGPVALTIRQELQPVLGGGAVFFPPTFAPPEGSDEAPDYLLDENVALVDTIGSQANRMEPLFRNEPYANLVPQAKVRIGEREVNLLDAGHRAADALVRFSEKWPELRTAFQDVRDKADATMLAKLAPTSIVFGAWDSRDTQAKLPRLIGATIRAEGARRLTRAAQYFSSFEKEEIEDLAPAKALSNIGLNDAPSGRSAGGITASVIRREAVVNLVALRSLRSRSANETVLLQRYILSLTLVTFACEQDGFLREGCLLVPDEKVPAEVCIVSRQGKRAPFTVTPMNALEYAKLASSEFGVGPNWTATFNRDTAKAAMDQRTEKKDAKSQDKKGSKNQKEKA